MTTTAGTTSADGPPAGGSRYDAIVVGAGHNGLIAAGYLAKAGNKVLVLERQATDRGTDSALLRDVWIVDANGDRALVAARLLEAGAATPAPAPPDTRYQAWLQAAAALARTNDAGLWGACGDVSASTGFAPDDARQLAFLGGAWRSRWELSG